MERTLDSPCRIPSSSLGASGGTLRSPKDTHLFKVAASHPGFRTVPAKGLHSLRLHFLLCKTGIHTHPRRSVWPTAASAIHLGSREF